MIEILKKHPFFADKSIASCALLENQGHCNENYLVVADGVNYIVRKLLREDIDRDFEWKVHSLAFKEGITAEPLFFDKENGFMVFEFLEGEHKEVESSLPHKVNLKSLSEGKPVTSKDELILLVQTLQKLHNIKIDAKPITIDIENKSDEVIQAFNTLEKYPREYVLCHNDLNPQNVFFTHDVKFIDFEYAGVNDRYFDLACVCEEFGLGEGMQKVFLEAYFEEERYVLEKLEAYKVMYKVLCEEWFNTSVNIET